MHLVQLEDVVVAADKHRLVRRVVDEVVRGSAAHAANDRP